MARALVQFPVDQLTAEIRDVQGQLAADRRNLLQKLGTQLLSLSQQSYREKARGGTGSDGITWSPLQRKTIEARVRQRAPAKRIVAERRNLARQIKAAYGPGAKNLKRRLRERRQELSRQLQSLVDREFANYEIGVNTGLQRSSAGPGFAAPDGQGGNILQLDANAVTVGYGRSYSEYFDARRALLPGEIPAEWQRQLDGVAESWAADILNQTLGAR